MPYIDITAHDGGTFKAYIAYPETKPAPAVIMIQEIFGINEEMRKKCDDMAAKGYVAVCPDLFWRIEPGIELVDSKPAELERAFELFGLFDTGLGVKDLDATLKAMREYDACNGKVGCVGYCLGGQLAYMMATRTDVDASVGYYGVAIDTMLDETKNIKSPLLLHIAELDEFVPEAAQNKIIDHFAKNDLVTTYRYPAVQHAFARGQGMHYDESAAKLANERTAKFLSESL